MVQVQASAGSLAPALAPASSPRPLVAVAPQEVGNQRAPAPVPTLGPARRPSMPTAPADLGSSTVPAPTPTSNPAPRPSMPVAPVDLSSPTVPPPPLTSASSTLPARSVPPAPAADGEVSNAGLSPTPAPAPVSGPSGGHDDAPAQNEAPRTEGNQLNEDQGKRKRKASAEGPVTGQIQPSDGSNPKAKKARTRSATPAPPGRSRSPYNLRRRRT
jgi:hypothetical protein